MKTSMCLLASAMLFAGCNPLRHQEVLIDRGLPHQIAEDIQVPLLLRQPDGTFVTPMVGVFKSAGATLTRAVLIDALYVRQKLVR